MDDFIFITTERSKAWDFLHQMHSGFPEYNCVIQGTSKSKVAQCSNFEKLLSLEKSFVKAAYSVI